VRPTGRNTQGVKAVDLRENDHVVGLAVVDEERDLLTVNEAGFGKRTSFQRYRSQTRGGKGLINMKTVEGHGDVVSVEAVRDDDECVLITDRGVLVRIPAGEISRIGRNTQGVQVMDVMQEQNVVDLTLAVGEPAVESEGSAAADPETSS